MHFFAVKQSVKVVMRMPLPENIPRVLHLGVACAQLQPDNGAEQGLGLAVETASGNRQSQKRTFAQLKRTYHSIIL